MAYRAKKKSKGAKIAIWILLIVMLLGFASPFIIQLINYLSK